MYNETSNCVPVCDCATEPSKPALSELLGKLNDLSKENLNLVCSIGDNLYGTSPKNDGDEAYPIDCMESCIRNTLEYVNTTNQHLIAIRARL